MSPEYGATAALFPVDANTLQYLRESGRDADHVDLVERYTREQGMFRTDGGATPMFTELLDLDLASVVPSLAGPRRPQDRVALPGVWRSFTDVYGDGEKPAPAVNGAVEALVTEGGNPDDTAGVGNPYPVAVAAKTGAHVHAETLRDGAVVIAAITSCTNTSNPSVMIGAGLLAQKAVARGLQVPDYVKRRSLPDPGS